MIVYKFGGTSVGTPARMKQVASLALDDPRPKVVVLSAISGMTNKLVAFTQSIAQGDSDAVEGALADFENQYDQFVVQLLSAGEQQEVAKKVVEERLAHLAGIAEQPLTLEHERDILAQGELVSTALFTSYLREQGITCALLPALEFMRTDRSGEPDSYFIKSMLQKELQLHQGIELFVTQGFICRNAFGEIDNLKRGGSDFTATLIGQALGADEILIWTDIDGLHNNDPRIVDNTFPISKLSYREAAELAYFGAKILHPTCVLPAEKANIPILLKNTMDPKATGTKISLESADRPITALAAKDDIIAIKITSGRMLNAYGFLKRIFEVFERYETSIDMITTSEVAVSLTIDDPKHLSRIVDELKSLGEVEVDRDQASICVVGNFAMDQVGYASKIFDSMRTIPIRMISYGGSRYNVSILVQGSDKKKALQALNVGLFGLE